MIPISNSWGLMRNSISYAKIIEVASEAHLTAGRENAQEIANSYLPQMTLGEKIVDYVFCGYVKHDFMQQLYKLSYQRARLEINGRDSSLRTTPEMRKEVMEYSLYGHNSRIEIEERRINSMLRCGSLKFGNRPRQNPEFRDTYLLYQDYLCRSAIGLPLQSQNLYSRTTPPVLPGSFRFDHVHQIQPSDMDLIKRHGRLRCGDRTYQVRFTDDHQPVVMHVERDTQVALIQRRLSIFWSCRDALKKLADFRIQSGTTTISTENMLTSGEDMLVKSYSSHPEWSQFVDVLRGRLTEAINYLRTKFDRDSRMIEAEFIRLVNQAEPASVQILAQSALREKITLLETCRRTCALELNNFAAVLDEYCEQWSPDADPVIEDAFKTRLLKLTDQLRQFVHFEMSAVAVARFKTLCSFQNPRHICWTLTKLGELLVPTLADSWNYSLPPPGFETELNELLGMVRNPELSSERIFTVMVNLKGEQDTRIRLRIRQIEMGNMIGRSAGDWLTHPVLDGRHRSTEANRRIELMEEISKSLLTPKNSYTEAQLDALNAKKNACQNFLRNELKILEENGDFPRCPV